MPEPLTLYGAGNCDETERTRKNLRRWGVSFREIDILQDDNAAIFVRTISGGNQSTPTLVFGDGKRKLVLTEPTDDELLQALIETGHRTRR